MLHLLLRALDDTTLPDQAGEALRQVQAQGSRHPGKPRRRAASMAVVCMQGQVGEALYGRRRAFRGISHVIARRRCLRRMCSMLAQRGRCPACGSAPVAGVITGVRPGARGALPALRPVRHGVEPCAGGLHHVWWIARA